MKITAPQLPQLLQQSIAPIYLISGDETLLVEESCTVLRQYLQSKSYSDREVFYLETNFNWESFIATTSNRSLWQERSIIELRLQNKISASGSAILQRYFEHPNPEKVILMISGKLDTATQKTAWYQAIDKYGVVLPIWPIETAQLPGWIAQRLQQVGLKTDTAGLKLLADYSAGNLLAASQEVEKLRLIYGAGNVSAEQIMTAITDNARFNVFNLVDAVLLGQKATVIRILNNVQAEDIEPTLILWALAKELRALINISAACANGTNLDTALAKYQVWSNRKSIVKQALQRHKLQALENLIPYLARIDRIIKGADAEHQLWQELTKFCLQFCK
jgi:DNA polymerase III subunit delta